jgi:hypothetical protein
LSGALLNKSAGSKIGAKGKNSNSFVFQLVRMDRDQKAYKLKAESFTGAVCVAELGR